MDSTTSGILATAGPGDYFNLFLTPDILNTMVDQKNLYADQYLSSGVDVSKHSRTHRWEPTNTEEMKKFVALLGWMGLVKLPKLADYWRKNRLYQLQLKTGTDRQELILYELVT